MSGAPAPEIRQSVLNAWHAAAGATFTTFAGWRLPLRFSGELAEHQAVRNSASLFDISHMGQLTIIGPQAATVVSRSFVGDVGALEVGCARYTMACNDEGGVLDDLIVYRLSDEEFLVVANAANTDVVMHHLDAVSAGLEAAVTNNSRKRALFSLQGPAATRMIAQRAEELASLPSRYRLAHAHIEGRGVLLTRTGYTGEDGFEIGLDAADAEIVWSRLLEGDGEEQALPAGLAARDSLRLEAGLPLYGHELTLARSPLEAGLERFVDLDHDFVGAAALRALARGGVTERLVGLMGNGGRSPRQGYTVYDLEGVAVGVVTSGGPSPTLHRPIAMAFVKIACSAPGSSLQVDVGGRMERLDVVALPFYRRSRRPAP